MTEEVWKPIKGYELRYEVSNLSNIRSVDRMVKRVSRAGKEFLIPIKSKEIKTKPGGTSPYLVCALSKEGVSKSILVHRIIAISFIPNPENKPEVNHINGVKTDNRIENLEWCTRGENIRHAFDVLNHKVASTGKYGKDCLKSIPIGIYKDGVMVERTNMLSELKGRFHLGTVINCCRGRRDTYKDFTFKYENKHEATTSAICG